MPDKSDYYQQSTQVISIPRVVINAFFKSSLTELHQTFKESTLAYLECITAFLKNNLVLALDAERRINVCH